MSRRLRILVVVVILLPILYLTGCFPVFYATGRWFNIPAVRSASGVYLIPYYWSLDHIPGFNRLGPALYAGWLRRGAEAGRSP